jgi:hypothetical protein
MDVIQVKPKRPPADPPPPKRKHVMTPARQRACEANSKKSTGPSEEGKKTSRLNRVSHALCSELPLVMPGEDPEAVNSKIERYISILGAANEVERDQVILAVHALARVQRSAGAGIAAATRVVNRVKNQFDNEQQLVVKDLVANLQADPAGSLVKLRCSSHGIHWLLKQITLLEGFLDIAYSFHPGQRLHAISLFGRRPQDLFTDRVVMQWNLDYLSGLHGPNQITAAQAAEILKKDRPAEMPHEEFELRLNEVLPALTDRKQGNTYLKEALKLYRQDLRELLTQVEDQEAIDQALAVTAAMSPVDDEGMRRLRYQRENERAYHGALRQLRSLQEMRLKYEGVLGDGVDPVATEADEDEAPAVVAGVVAAETSEVEAAREPGPEASATPRNGASETSYRNEAAAPQVKAVAVGCTGDRPAPTGFPRALDEGTREELLRPGEPQGQEGMERGSPG